MNNALLFIAGAVGVFLLLGKKSVLSADFKQTESGDFELANGGTVSKDTASGRFLAALARGDDEVIVTDDFGKELTFVQEAALEALRASDKAGTASGIVCAALGTSEAICLDTRTGTAFAP